MLSVTEFFRLISDISFRMLETQFLLLRCVADVK